MSFSLKAKNRCPNMIVELNSFDRVRIFKQKRITIRFHFLAVKMINS